jgi:hypothetical protein
MSTRCILVGLVGPNSRHRLHLRSWLTSSLAVLTSGSSRADEKFIAAILMRYELAATERRASHRACNPDPGQLCAGEPPVQFLPPRSPATSKNQPCPSRHRT